MTSVSVPKGCGPADPLSIETNFPANPDPYKNRQHGCQAFINCSNNAKTGVQGVSAGFGRRFTRHPPRDTGSEGDTTSVRAERPTGRPVTSVLPSGFDSQFTVAFPNLML